VFTYEICVNCGFTEKIRDPGVNFNVLLFNMEEVCTELILKLALNRYLTLF
jgi:hypothetical protein